MKCPGCGGVIRDDEQTCDSLDCSPYDCTTCNDEGWIAAGWLRNKKDAERYPKLRVDCPECTLVTLERRL